MGVKVLVSVLLLKYLHQYYLVYNSLFNCTFK